MTSLDLSTDLICNRVLFSNNDIIREEKQPSKKQQYYFQTFNTRAHMYKMIYIVNFKKNNKIDANV